jgi:uncharacterized protein YjdB
MIKKLNTLVVRGEATQTVRLWNKPAMTPTTVIARSGELNEQATRQSTHRLLALMTVFALAFVGLTAITGPTQSANAVIANVTYIDENGDAQTAVDATKIEDSTELTTGWYYVDNDTPITTTNLKVSGDVKIILVDGSQLTANGGTNNAGINVSSPNSLSIYGQTLATGEIVAQGGQYGTGIGANYGAERNSGTINISGGNITAAGRDYSAGIGGGSAGNNGTIIITGGTVIATGGQSAAGIGGGYIGGGNTGGGGGTISITGGLVTATGGNNAPGIGIGRSGPEATISIRGNSTVVKATGGPAQYESPFDINSAAGILSVTNDAKLWLTSRGANAASVSLQNSIIYGTGADGYTKPSGGIDIWGVYGATTNSNLNSTGTISGPSLSFGTSNAAKTFTVKNNGLAPLSSVTISFPEVSGELAESADAFEIVSAGTGLVTSSPTGLTIPPLGTATITVKPKTGLLALDGASTYTYKNTATLSWTNQVNYDPTIVTEQNHTVPASYEAKAVNSVTVAPTSTTITYGQTSWLTETVLPSEASQSVTWSSSNTDVATVNSSGLVTSVSAGDATITAKSTDYPTKYGTTSVTVSKKPLTVSLGSIVIPDRPYIAGTITAPVTGVVTIDSGIVNSDAITVSSCSGDFADDTVGAGKAVDLTCSLAGPKASSYTIASYPVAQGTILDYTEVDLGGHELEVPTDAAVTPESAPGAGDGYVTLPTTDPEYEVIVDDVTVIVPGGSIIHENGTITVPAGSVTVSGETVAVPAGSVINPATGDITLPNGKVAVTQTKGSERLTLSSATITQGKTLTISGSGFTPNELVRLELHNPTQVLSVSVTVNASGKFTLTKAVTTATAVGNYQVVAYDNTSNIQLKSVNLKVVKPAPTKPGPVSAKTKKVKGSITFIWGASGFLTTVEIYYRVKGNSKWKVVRVSGASSKKIKLKRKKTYQFQLRSYKTVNGKNYYSAWTKKTVKL